MVKVAVTGGTGFVGRNLVERLLAEEHRVTVLARRSHGEGLFGGKAKLVAGSVIDNAALAEAFRDAEAVYHLVGIIAESKSNTFEKTVVGGTRQVVDACRQANVKKVIYLSAMGTSDAARSRYHKTKYLAEQTVISSGLDYVIYRPSVIYGLQDGFISLLTRIIRWSPITPVIGRGRYRLQPVYIDDVISAMVQGLTVAKASRQIIEIGGPDKLEYRQILNAVKGVVGKSTLNFYVPLPVLKVIAFVMESLFKPAPLTRDQLAMMEMGNTGDIRRMRELFSINPVKLEDGLKKYLR